MQEQHTVETSRPRGRQPGTKVQSLDYRAYKALRGLDFDTFVTRANEDKNDDWRNDLIDAIIARLRDQDIF